MGELVREYGLIPDVIISSDAVRARLTAEAVAEAARYAGEILLDPHLYLAGPEKAVADVDQGGRPDDYLTAKIDAVSALSTLLTRLGA